MRDSRSVHVIHLGDVYFAGEAEEYRRHVLADGWWPVTDDQAEAGVGSWSLAGNHDLYGGAHAYFTVLLGDGRFRLQRDADGAATSWFRITLPSWDVIGTDTSWNDDPFEQGQTGLLQDPQAQRLAQWIAEDDGNDNERRKRLVLSHHQFMTVYDNGLLRVLEHGPEGLEPSDLTDHEWRSVLLPESTRQPPTRKATALVLSAHPLHAKRDVERAPTLRNDAAVNPG